MSLLEWRGGLPVVFTGTVDINGDITDPRSIVIASPIVLGSHARQGRSDGRLGPVTSKWLCVVNHDTTDDLRLYFTQDHFDEDVHYVTLDSQAGVAAHTVFKGPAEIRKLWVRAVTNTVTFEVVAFVRRG